MGESKEGKKNPTYQLGRRRHTRVPGYGGVLPKVFPYRWRCSIEQAYGCIRGMHAELMDGFAVTSHPASTDGHVHLWMSVEVAEYLVGMDMISRISLEEM